tara:strand:+ start:641 stop:811 length:171 start_codon:yes stop_codon:yes gene_type:complete
MERYPSGLRGRFAKPLVGVSPARVRIPLSPPEKLIFPILKPLNYTLRKFKKEQNNE